MTTTPVVHHGLARNPEAPCDLGGVNKVVEINRAAHAATVAIAVAVQESQH